MYEPHVWNNKQAILPADYSKRYHDGTLEPFDWPLDCFWANPAVDGKKTLIGNIKLLLIFVCKFPVPVKQVFGFSPGSWRV